MQILLLSAYDTLSHRKWRECLQSKLTEYSWEVLTLAPRYFNFRVRTSAVAWHHSEKALLEKEYDLVIATSLSDITMLKALTPKLAQTPFWLYCHENQFAYPTSNQQNANHSLDIKTSFYFNCLAANHISFNSEWNRSTALDGMRQLLKRWPEKIPLASVDQIEDKSSVLPVPLLSQKPLANNLTLERQQQHRKTAVEIIWNHRWEYDKGPSLLLAFVQQLRQLLEAHRSTSLTLHIVGQRFREQPPAFAEIDQLIEELTATYKHFHRGSWGFIADEDEYLQLLKQADVVLSTSLHDFQGLAIQEAVVNGCIPLLPNTLVYPEIFDAAYLYEWSDETERCALQAINKLQQWLNNTFPPAPSSDAFMDDSLLDSYRARIERFR